jgi:hypothetical protein
VEGKQVILQREIEPVGYAREKNQQLVLEAEVSVETPLTFTVHIRESQAGRIVVGVLDRRQVQSRSSHSSHSAVSYCVATGMIIHGTTGVWNYQDETNTGIRWDNAGIVKVEVVVNLVHKRAFFTFTDKNGKSREYQIESNVLSWSNPQLLPFIELCDAGDSVTWDIK